MGGSTRPIALSRGEGVWCISSHATITYHGWGWLCVRKRPLGKYVDRSPRGAECETEGPSHVAPQKALIFHGRIFYWKHAKEDVPTAVRAYGPLPLNLIFRQALL